MGKAKACFEIEAGHPVARVQLLANGGRGSCRVNRSMKRRLHGRACPDGTWWVMPAMDIEDFLTANNVDLDCKSVNGAEVINKESITWYTYEAGHKTHLCMDIRRGRAFVDTWMNHDCPPLTKWETNAVMEDGARMYANALCGSEWILFSSVLAEYDMDGVRISQDATDAECNAFVHACAGTQVGDTAARMLEARKLEASNIEQVKQRVNACEMRMQAVLNRHEGEITAAIESYKHDPNALDCGFQWFTPTGELLDDVLLLIAAGVRAEKKLNIHVPYVTQSVDAQRLGAIKAAEFIAAETEFKVEWYTELD